MKKGTITVYLALVLSVLLSFLTLLISAARDSVIRLKTECSMDAALYSVFAEYNRELFERYDLIFIDTSYGCGQGRTANCEVHLQNYMNRNFDLNKKYRAKNAKDLLALTAVGVKITDRSFATDNNGELFERQAADYVRSEYGLDCLTSLKQYLQTAETEGFFTRDVAAEQSANQSQIDGMEKPQRQIAEDEWEEVPLDNPADAVNAARGIDLLSFVLPEDSELSMQSVNLDNYVSGRNCQTGSGVGERKHITMTDKILLDRYILQKADCYTSEKAEGELKYQLEYVINGKETDVDNLKKTVEKLLFIRQAANAAYLFQDGAKVAEAEALALSLTAVSLAPEFAEPVKISILLAWAYAESVYDIRLLLSGKKVPLLKTAESWHLGLSEMLRFREHLSDEKSTEPTENGLSYEEYLGMLLLQIDHKDKVERMMDVIEMGVRCTKGNQSFRLDACIDYLEAQAIVESLYGYSCEIKRSYYYY